MTSEPTPMMAAVGFSLVDVQGLAAHVANLLEKDGAAVADLARNLLKLIAAVSGRDLVGIISALTAAGADYKKIAADVRAEFGI